MITAIATEAGIIFGLSKTHRLDITNAGKLEKRVLRTHTDGSVLLSLEGIQFIDTAGFSILLRIQGRIESKGLKFLIINVSNEVKELIYLLKIEHVLNLVMDHSEELPA